MRGPASLEQRLRADTEAAALARDAVGNLESFLAPQLFEDVRLVTSELVTNAVRHGGSGAELSLRVDATTRPVLVEVEDGGPGFVPQYPPRPRDISGWGLCLVDRLAARWGVAVTGRGTRVWAELASPVDAGYGTHDHATRER